MDVVPEAAGNNNNPPPALYNPQVIDALENLHDDVTDALRRWLRIDIGMAVSERDAIYTVGFLHALLLEERTTDNNSNNSRPTIIRRTTGLHLAGGEISYEAIAVFCDFLQRTNDLPSALSLGDLPPQQYHRLMTSLQTNTSVKALHIFPPVAEHPVSGQRISSLLHHRSDDLSVLDFCDGGYGDFHLTNVLPFICTGLPHLRKLRFYACNLGDDDVESIVRALVVGNHGVLLEELDLSCNHITSRGLRSLCALAPSTFASLQKLKLCVNTYLFQDLGILRGFIREVLLALNTTLKELEVSYCLPDEADAQGYTLLIKALESNHILRRLDISQSIFHEERVQDGIRDQLVESLPKMKGIRELTAAWELYHEDDMELVVAAIRQNRSLHKLSRQGGGDNVLIPFTPTPVITAIFKRNKHMNLLDELLGTATAATVTGARTEVVNHTATAPTIIPHGLWPRVLETVGQGRGEGGSEGASPVFKILQARLASWPESNNRSGNKRKREDATTLNSLAS